MRSWSEPIDSMIREFKQLTAYMSCSSQTRKLTIQTKTAARRQPLLQEM